MTFEFGVASGDISHNRATLWTRTTPSTRVQWSLTDRDGTDRHGTAESTEHGFVHVDVADLAPGTAWYYRFEAAGEASEWARFRTLPVDRPVRFAVVSCAKFNSGYFNAYEAIANNDQLDFVLHLGDYIYEAGQVPRGNQTPGIDIGRVFDPPHDCVTLDDYDRRYAQYRRDPQLQKLHAAHGMIFTLDDHEIADNAWSHGAEEHFPDDGPWEERLASALTAWQQWQPTLRTPADGNDLWHEVSLGDVGSLFVCDTRLSRSDPSEPDPAKKTVLGARQLGALETLAASSDKPWLVVGMPSKFLSLEAARSDPAADYVFQTLKLSERDGTPHHDRWDAYPHEQSRLLRSLENSSSRTLMLCGDVHFAAHSETTTGKVIECLTSSISSPNFDDKSGWAYGDKSRPYEQKLVELIPELAWCDLDRHGYLIVEVSREAVSCEWWGVTTVTEPFVDVELLHSVLISATQARGGEV